MNDEVLTGLMSDQVGFYHYDKSVELRSGRAGLNLPFNWHDLISNLVEGFLFGSIVPLI